MKFLIIHNQYSRRGGEENVVELQRRILTSHGHAVIEYSRKHGEVSKARSLFTALRNPAAIRDIREICKVEKPDVAIIHNLFPVISAAIIPELHAAGVKILMTLHNYRLSCPNGLFYTHGAVCESCGKGSVINCALKRCQGSLAGSVAWSLRAAFSSHYFRFVDAFLALSEFQKQKITTYSDLPTAKFHIVPNCIDIDTMPVPSTEQRTKDYIAYVGRLSKEKGVELLFETARRMPECRFKVAGEKAENLLQISLPANIELLGFLDRQQLADFYSNAQKVVLTSGCYEGFPLTVIEAMYYNATVVVPQWAALPEIVDNGECGVLYTPNDVESLVQKLGSNYNFEDKPYQRVTLNYNAQQYYENIIRCI